MNISNLTIKEKYQLARYLYKYGMSPFSDVEYDSIEKELKQNTDANAGYTDFFDGGFESNPFETSYDDDTQRPTDILNKTLTEAELKQLALMENSGKAVETLDAYVSKSMQSYRTLKECYDWINSYYGVEFCISPKIDGINSTTSYVGGSFDTARTRGRGKNAIDIGTKMKQHLPDSINYNDQFILAAEVVVTRDHLEQYNQMVNSDTKTFVTCRGSALSILRRTDIPAECTDFIKTFVFRTNVGKTLSEGLGIAKSLGFNTVPHETYTFKYTTYEEYEKELAALIWKYKEIMENMNIPTDGLVLQINNNSYFTETATHTAYDGGNLAVKALAWEPGIYTSRVKDIVMNADSTVQYNCKAIVELTYTEEGKCMQYVNLYNINTMITNDIHIGDLIQFEYVNETTINFRKKVTLNDECNSEANPASEGTASHYDGEYYTE